MPYHEIDMSATRKEVRLRRRGSASVIIFMLLQYDILVVAACSMASSPTVPTYLHFCTLEIGWKDRHRTLIIGGSWWAASLMEMGACHWEKICKKCLSETLLRADNSPFDFAPLILVGVSSTNKFTSIREYATLWWTITGSTLSLNLYEKRHVPGRQLVEKCRHSHFSFPSKIRTKITHYFC